MVTGKVRLSYLKLIEPGTMPGSDVKKFAACLLIAKDDKETLTKYKAEVEQAKAKGIEKNMFTKAQFGMLKIPLRDGDAEYEAGQRGPEYKGHFFINSYRLENQGRPGVVDAQVDPIMDLEEVYSGCYAKVHVSLYPYNRGGSRGIAAGLNNIQKIANGDRLDGRLSAEEVFEKEQTDEASPFEAESDMA